MNFCRIFFGSRFPTSRWKPGSERRNSLQAGQNSEREREINSHLVCLRKGNRSAIYSAPGGAFSSARIQQLRRFGQNRSTVQTAQRSNRPTARTVFRQPLAGGSAAARARMPACAGIVPSFSRAKTPSTQRARPLFSIFSIYTPQTSIPQPMWD